MIRCELTFQGDNWCSFMAQGHAQFAVKGEDIVCAAFSCLVRTVCRYCSKQGWLSVCCMNDDALYFELCRGAVQKEETIVQLLMLGLRDLELEYPQNIKLEIKEKV